MNCLWCDRPFEAKTMGGREKRFCSDRCRQVFHNALRLWGRVAFREGLVSIETLKGFISTCTLAGVAKPPSPADEAA